MQHSARVSLVLALFAACSTPHGDGGGEGHRPAPAKTDDVAGGQSGTDSNGEYHCDLEGATESDAPLDSCALTEAVESLSWVTTVSSLAEGQHPVFWDCGSFGRYRVEVEDATSARLLTGIMDGEGEGGACVAYTVLARTHVVSLDGGAPFEAESFDTDHICWNKDLVAVREDGARAFISAEVFSQYTSLRMENDDVKASCTRVRVMDMPTELPEAGGAAGAGGTDGAAGADSTAGVGGAAGGAAGADG